MPAGEQAVDGSDASLRCDDQSVQPSNGLHSAVVAGGGLERPHHGGAHRNDAGTGGTGGVDLLSRRPRHPDPLGVGQLARFERCHAGVEHSGAMPTPLATSRVMTSVVNGRPGARHLGAARLGGVHVLVGARAARGARRSGSGSGARARRAR